MRTVPIVTVTVKGTGKYTGTVKGSFIINPKRVSGLKLKAGKEQLEVSWKKASGISGYEIQYGLKKDFKGAETATVKKTASKATIKKLEAGKKYYARIRAYRTVKGTKYYSAWSKAKAAKVK